VAVRRNGCLPATVTRILGVCRRRSQTRLVLSGLDAERLAEVDLGAFTPLVSESF
jgi:hypothetical protein